MKATGLAILFALAANALCFAETGALAPFFQVSDINLFALGATGGVEGIEVVPGVPSRLLANLGGGYVESFYWRDEAGNRLVPGDRGFDGRSSFWRWQARSCLGVNLGLLRSEDPEKNALALEAYLKSSYRRNEANGAFLFDSSENSRDGFWENSLYAGLSLDLLKRNRAEATIGGVSGKLNVEWAPKSALNSVFGDSAYTRLNGSLTAFLPLSSGSSFCLYAGERFVADALYGPAITYEQRSLVGGAGIDMPDPGIGYALRGVEDGRFDSYLKLINNIDIRATFPGIFGPVCIPELLLFFDAAAYDELDYELRYGADGLYSTGLGLYLNFQLKLGDQMQSFVLGYLIAYDISEDRFMFDNIALGARCSF